MFSVELLFFDYKMPSAYYGNMYPLLGRSETVGRELKFLNPPNDL